MHQDLIFILNLIANDTSNVELYRKRLEEFCGGDDSFKHRINNILELLKIEVDTPHNKC